MNRTINIKSISKAVILLYVISLFTIQRIDRGIMWNAISMVFYLTMYLQFIIAKKKLKINFFVIWSIGFIIICFSSLLWSIDGSVTQNLSLVLMKNAIPGLMILVFIKNKEDFDYVIRCMMYAGAVSVFYILYLQGITVGERFGSDVANANQVGVYLAISLLSAIYIFMKTGKKNYLWFVGIIGMGALLTGSRKVVMFGLIGLFILLLNGNRGNKIKKVFIFTMILFVVYYTILNIPILYQSLGVRVESFISDIVSGGNGQNIDASMVGRRQFIENGLLFFKNQPIFGYGLGTFGGVNSAYGGVNTYAHNNYIELMVGIGLIGLISYYLIHFYLILNTLRFRMISHERLALSLILSLVVSIMISDFGMVSYIEKLIVFLFAIFCRYILIIKEQYKNV